MRNINIFYALHHVNLHMLIPHLRYYVEKMSRKAGQSNEKIDINIDERF